MSETDGGGTWVYTNVYANGELIGTYTPSGVNFHLNDWLGTRRMDTDALGKPGPIYQSYPFGELVPGAPTITSPEHFFTGKQRDQESDLDYFGARHYASSMGRFMSPDWSGEPQAVPYANLANPQTLNLYGYVGNNPLSAADPSGHLAGVFNILNATSLMQDEAERYQQQAQRDAQNTNAAQQQSGATLPSNPSGLGAGWQDVTPAPGGKVNPKIPKRFRGPKGTEIEFDPGVAGARGWGGKDHWHEVGPDGKRVNGHLAPGAPMPGPDGAPEPPASAERSIMDLMRSITPAPLLKWGTAGIITYMIIDEGSRLYPPRNLIPVP